MDRQGEDLVRRSLRLREVAATVAERREARLQVERDRVVDLARDAARRQMAPQRLPPRDADHVLVEDVRRARGDGRERHLVLQARGAEELVVVSRAGAAGGVPALDVLELDGEDGCLDRVESAVEPDLEVLVATLSSVGPQAAHPRRQRIVPGDHQPGVSDGPEVLGRVEAQTGEVAVADAPAVARRTDRLRGVLHDGEAMTPRDRVERPHVAALSVEVHRQERAGVLGQSHRRHREAEVRGIDVGEDRRRTQPDDRGGRREEAEGRGHDLVSRTHVEGHERQEERVGSRGDADRMAHAEVLGDRRLEASDRLAQDVAAAPQDLQHRGLELGPDLAVLGAEIEERDRRRLSRGHGATRSRRIAGTVRSRIIRSSQSDHRSMYSRSAWRPVKNGWPMRFLTCQRPVIPGSIEKRFRCHDSKPPISLASIGRGPIKLISPRRTFTSWGSSSMSKRRSHRPTRVTRGSRQTLKIGPSASFIGWRSGASDSAPSTMLRNLSIRKRRLLSPIRSWTKKTGPGESSLIAIATRSQSGASTAIRTGARTRSIARLTARPHGECSCGFSERTRASPACSSVAAPRPGDSASSDTCNATPSRSQASISRPSASLDPGTTAIATSSIASWASQPSAMDAS